MKIAATLINWFFWEFLIPIGIQKSRDQYSKFTNFLGGGWSISNQSAIVSDYERISWENKYMRVHTALWFFNTDRYWQMREKVKFLQHVNFAVEWKIMRGEWFHEFLLFSKKLDAAKIVKANFLISSINDFLILIGVMKVIIVTVKLNFQMPDQYSLIKNKARVVICLYMNYLYTLDSVKLRVKIQLKFISWNPVRYDNFNFKD